ncbi:MAG: DUF5686 and carboxypeptidase regulatory-like domain-containing protein [Bacteroidia bacterium]
MFWLIKNVCIAQTITGTVTDSLGNPLSFVNVFVKNTQIGTTTNENGFFSIQVPPNNSTIIFQYVGFKQYELECKNGDELKNIQIKLKPIAYALKEAAITATAEDPAYPIMRQVIARSKLYANEVASSTCKVYMKSLQRLTTIPKRILLLKIPAEVQPGIIYLSETLSELTFSKPDRINERTISSKVSGASKGFSFNRAGSIKFNLYEPNIPGYGISERGFISPLAPNAFFYYKYKLEATEIENGLTIYKIRLEPIRKHDPVFKGYIYIVKDLWRLHSVDVTIDKSTNIEFIDNLNIKQNYIQLPNGMWMPQSIRFIYNFDILGIKGNGYVVAIYSNFKAVSNYSESFYNALNQKLSIDDPVPQVKSVKRVIEKPENKSKLITNTKNKNELLSTNSDANKFSKEAWDTIRPIVLSDEEIEEYRNGDSIEQIIESKPYKDSVDRINNKPSVADIIINGYRYENSFKNYFISFQPFINTLQFNTVEGFVFNEQISFNKFFDEEKKSIQITPTIRYGFASNKLYATLGSKLNYNQIKLSSIAIEGGSMAKQINQNNPISPFVNSVYTLFARQNFMKLFESNFFSIKHQTEWVNGILQQTSLTYEQRKPLFNRSDFSFSSDSLRSFTLNQPENYILQNTDFTNHNALIFETNFRIMFEQKYISRVNYRYRFRSKYPSLNIKYTKGISFSNANINFDKIIISTKHSSNLKLLGTFDWQAALGCFLNTKNMSFIDFHHFNGNQTIFSNRGFNGFQMLNYYFYSTNSSFFEASGINHFNGFLFNKIAFLRKTKLQEVAGVRYLKTPQSPHITELVLGIEHIFKIFRADLNFQYLNGKHTASGIRFGYGF